MGFCLLDTLYKWGMNLSAPALRGLLQSRVKRGKEEAFRLNERMGEPSMPRPHGPLIWLHAASVGESLSALILIDALLKAYPGLHLLVTTGTRTSADLMAKRLPKRAFHQYIPLDHPGWVNNFLNHWTPDAALWMESELWPNTLREIKNRAIPAALINARLSDRSFSRWMRARRLAGKILASFQLILTQSDSDKERFEELGARHVLTSDNLKYSAPPLPFDERDLNDLLKAIDGRPVWLYASTHDGEEELATHLQNRLKQDHPGLLTIIVPRHPERSADIKQAVIAAGAIPLRRTETKKLPTQDTEIYIADTMGEMGLFYRAVSIAMVGRSFSKDGGGGHNLIEPAQLDCAVLTGPNVQFQKHILNDMLEDDAILQLQSESDLEETLRKLLDDPAYLSEQKNKAARFARKKQNIIGFVMENLKPVLSAIPTLNDRAA